MRLINTDTLELEEFVDESLPRYGILSHTWGEEEITFQQMQSTVRPRRRKGYKKIQYTCQQAQKDHLTHVWIDTCCIDKRSSAELQEAINSMWNWYSQAEKCYVHMYDISDHCPVLEDLGLDEETDETRWNRVFANCRWFTRGWTLQEMIAPKDLAFYGPKWSFIGTKKGLIKTLSAATKVEPSVLMHTTNVSSMSVAQRMSWAANRLTSRIEDRAYSLLGIFDVNMPLLYGEGSKAFIRLQEEIIKTSTDHSIFAWDFKSYESPKGSLLASSPSNFANCSNIVQWGKRGTFEMTNRGLRITLPTVTAVTDYEETFAVLNCRYANDLSGTLALRLQKYGGGDEYHAMKGFIPRHPDFVPAFKAKYASRTTFLTEQYMYIAASRVLPLQITREFEPESSKLKFWVPLLDTPFHVVEVYPEESWDQHDGIMHAAENPKVRGAVMIESLNGTRFSLGFGFDLAAVDGEQESRYLPGIWGTRWNGRSPLKEICESNRQCYHTEQCAQGYCPWMPASVTVYEYPETVKLECQISKATIMEDVVFVVSIRISEVFEFQAAEPSIELDGSGVALRRAGVALSDAATYYDSDISAPITPDTPKSHVISPPTSFNLISAPNSHRPLSPPLSSNFNSVLGSDNLVWNLPPTTGSYKPVYSADIYEPLPTFSTNGFRSSTLDSVDHSLFESNPFAAQGTSFKAGPYYTHAPSIYDVTQSLGTFELDAIETERTTIIRKPQKADERRLIVASIIPPLQHLLTNAERACPVHVYMRLPAAMNVLDRAPPLQCRKIAHRVRFWAFEWAKQGRVEIAGGVVLRLPSWQKVALMFHVRPGLPSPRCALQLRELSAAAGSGERLIRRRVMGAGAKMAPLSAHQSVHESLYLPADACMLQANARCHESDNASGGFAMAIDLHLEQDATENDARNDFPGINHQKILSSLQILEQHESGAARRLAKFNLPEDLEKREESPNSHYSWESGSAHYSQASSEVASRSDFVIPPLQFD